jgi:signal transduction histidine kinase
MSANFSQTIDHFAGRLAAEHTTLARAWLERLDALVAVDRHDVFPSPQLLDHIPDVLREIAVYLRAPADEEIAANTAVMAKAGELGELRFDQQASVHQLLREYQLLGAVLEEFFAREAARLGDRADATAAVLAVSRAQQAVQVLQQKTVDAFISRSTATIARQHARIRQLSRAVGIEIRRPLAALRATGAAAAGPAGSAEFAAHLGRLDAVAGMLDRLARLARPTDAAPNRQTVQLTALARDIAGQLTDVARTRGVRIEIADDLPELTADAGHVELVLMNLLANAIRFSDPAKSDRWVRVAAADGAGPALRIADNGLGIAAGRLAVIADQFLRPEAHLDDELGPHGMGLGLAIARDSMEAMDGVVTVESREGHGTAVHLVWPAPPPRSVPADR